MGLFDTLGGYAKDKREEMEAIRERYEHYDDERLKRDFQRASGVKKVVIGTLLKERGY